MKRYCTPFIAQDLSKKMVFVGGPRQVGKTTLAKSLLRDNFSKGEYLNWDDDRDRHIITERSWRKDAPLVVFDELHKYPRWKNWIKGVYDNCSDLQNFLLTGSARLDLYKKGGDSLLGRYHYWRLHPLTIDELPPNIGMDEGLNRLLSLGGFPEAFLGNDERDARRWRRERFDRVLREDIQDLEPIKELQSLRLFVDALRKRVGGLVVMSNIAEDIQISPKTAKSWLSIIENMYVAFAVYPMTNATGRSIQKPPKVYFYDNGDVDGDDGARLENLVATTLLKRLHFIEDYHGYRCSLHYIRDKDKREVDFATVVDGKLVELIEVKSSDGEVSSALRYYTHKLKPQRSIQIVHDIRRPLDVDGIRVCGVADYFQDPPWEHLN